MIQLNRKTPNSFILFWHSVDPEIRIPDANVLGQKTFRSF